MRDEAKTKEQLLTELHELRERVAELEGDKAGPEEAEGLLKTRLRCLYTVLSSLYAGVLLVSEAGRVEFANKAFCDLFHLECSPEELKGQSSSEIIARIQSAYADPVAAVNHIQEILDRDLPSKGEEVALRDGRTCLRDFIPLDEAGRRFGCLWHHQDITERRRAEEALRDSQDRLNLALKSSRAGIWDRDIAADKATWDEHLHALFGLLPGSFSGRLEDFLGMVHPDDQERVRGEMTAAMEGDADYSTTYRVVRPDSSVHFLADRGKVYRDFAGRPVRMVGVNLDITEMKQAEESLRENERKFHSIFDCMSEMVVLHELICDAGGRPVDYRILDCNPAFTRSTGIPAEKAVGVRASQFYDRSEPPYLEAYAQVALTGKPVQFEAYFAPMQKHFAISAVSPAPGRFATVSTDITELKRAEEALKERDLQFKKLASHVPGMIYQFMKRADGTYCCPFTTEAIEDIFGCSPEDVREDFSPIARVILPEDLDKLICSIEASAECLTPWQCEYRVQIPGRPGI